MAIESMSEEHRPLSAGEQKEYDEQLQGLAVMGQDHHAGQGKHWREGRLCQLVRDTAFWRRDRSHTHTELMAFLYDKAGMQSDTTIERRLALADNYTFDEYMSYIERGICKTVLYELTLLGPQLRGPLLEYAKTKKLSIKDVEIARAAAAEELLRVAKAREAGELDDEAMQLGIEQSILNHRKRQNQQKKDLAALVRDRRDNGDRAGGGASSAELAEAQQQARELRELLAARDRALESELHEKSRTIAEQGAALQKKDEEVRAQRALLDEVQADGGATPEALAQRLGELVAQRQALAQEQAALLAQRDALRAEQAALTQKQAEVAAQEAALHQQVAAAEAQIAAGKEAEDRLQAIPARLAELEARERAQNEREEQLASREAALYESHDLLDEREATIDDKGLQVETAWAEVNEAKTHINQEYVALERLAVNTNQGMFRWTDYGAPRCLDSFFNYFQDHLGRLYEITFETEERFDNDEALHQEGGLARIMDAGKLAGLFHGQIVELLKKLVEEYADRNPERVKEEQAEWNEEQAREAQNELSQKAPPEVEVTALESTFAVPIEAVVGTKNPRTPQVGLLAMRVDRKKGVAICLNKPQVINIIGLQGNGKSSTILAFVEMMLKSIKNVSKVPKAAAVLYCHFGESPLENPPGVARSDEPNSEKHGLVMLDAIGAKAEALGRRRTHFVPPMSDEDFEAYKAMYPGARVIRIAFDLSDLTTRDIRLFMGAAENSSMYMGRLDDILRRLKKGSTLDDLWAEILKAGFDSKQLALLEERMRRLRAYVTGNKSIVKEFVPGELFVIDIRRYDVSEVEAMVVFTVMMNCFSRARNPDGSNFTKGIVFDEAHKYLGTKSGITKQVLSMIREMRHRRMWVIIASQDAKSVPESVNELSTVTVVHHIKSKDDLRVLRKGNTAWDNVTAEDLASLEQGEVYIVVNEATDEVYQRIPQRMRIRATCCMPAGTTQLAVSEDD